MGGQCRTDRLRACVLFFFVHNMRMKRPRRKKAPRPPEWVNPAGGQQALQLLAPLLSILYTLIEAGVEASRVYFQERQKPVHNVVFATLVRLRIWEEVEERARAAGLLCRVVYKANVGVRVIYNGTTIAIWKADKDGKLPACGESEQRQLFYSQPLLAEMYGSTALPSKLALLWDQNDGLLNVQLVAPKGYESFWKSGLVHWAEPVPHPAEMITATRELASGAEELDDILKYKKTSDEPRR